ASGDASTAAPEPQGPSWATVASRHLPANSGQRGTSQNVQAASPATAPAKPRIDRGKAFSAIHLVDAPTETITRENETAVLPLRIVSNQHDYTNLSYQVPPNATKNEFIDAFCATQIEMKGSNHVHLYPKDNLAVVRFTDDNDHAAFKQATVTMRGQPLQMRAFKTYNPKITFVTLYGLMEADAKQAAILAKNAMTPFGNVLDIVLFKRGTFLADTAQIVMELDEDKTIDGIIHASDYIVHAVGKRVNKGCTYCKKEGHIRVDCPARPQSKRDRSRQAEKQSQQAAPDSPQNEARAKRKKVAAQLTQPPTADILPMGQMPNNPTTRTKASKTLNTATRPSNTQPATPTKPRMQTRAQASANKQATSSANSAVKPTRVKPVVQTTKVDKAGDTRVTYESMQVDDDESDDSSAPSLTDSLL
ncbi:hypothetical protein LPJ73_002769, partial [Coemansia sp. RSA 2703]